MREFIFKKKVRDTWVGHFTSWLWMWARAADFCPSVAFGCSSSCAKWPAAVLAAHDFCQSRYPFPILFTWISAFLLHPCRHLSIPCPFLAFFAPLVLPGFFVVLPTSSGCCPFLKKGVPNPRQSFGLNIMTIVRDCRSLEVVGNRKLV